MLRKSLFLTGFILFALCALGGNPFEGTIIFVKKSYYDTTEIHYQIKNNRIRIDEFSAKNERFQTFLVDLSGEKVIAVDPERKLYRPLHITRLSETPDSTYEIVKTENFKVINGVKCHQWRVKNKRLNSEIAYWVTEKNFAFYSELLKLLRRTERTYQFFTQIPGNKGYFPVLSVERTMLRDERERIVVKEIKPKSLNERLFKIPEAYTEMTFSHRMSH